MVVSSKANIFGAGHQVPPAPGGGGAGVLPPVVELPAEDNIFLTFPCVTGLINCCFDPPDTGAIGTTDFMTNIAAYGGISGVKHGARSVFLVGVFLGAGEPADPAPERLDFTDTCPAGCTFDRFEPLIGQTFYIGQGGELPEYVAPAGATRLFLGIADAYFTQGQPGWYDNNNGKFDVIVRLP